jgi:hypothetical protein
MAELREVRPGQACCKGAASLARRGSAIRNRRPHGARVRYGWIWGRGGRFGHEPIGICQGAVLWCGSPASIAGQVAGSRCHSTGQNRGGRERESEGRERKSEGPGSNEFFLKVCKETSKSANMKVVENLKLYDFHLDQSSFEL